MTRDRLIEAHTLGIVGRSGRGVRAATFLVIAALVLAACQQVGAPATTPTGTQGAASPGGGGDGGFPTGDITIVVPFAAGGPTDTVTRLIAEPMGEELDATIIIQNVAGAGGTVAAGQVAAAEPDGHTVLMHHIGMSTAPTLYPDLEYDPLEDFQTIGLVTEVPMTIVGANDFEPNTMEELVEHLEANAGTVTYANAGVGAASHLCGLLIEDALGVDLNEVSYDGTGPAMTDLLGGHVDFMCDQTTNTTEQILADQVKAYAVTTAEPVESLADIPTTADAGYPEIEVGVWHGLYVPAGTPDEAVQALTQALQAALEDETVIERLGQLGAAPMPQDQATPEAHTQRLQEQIELWAPILEAAPTPAPASPAGS